MSQFPRQEKPPAFSDHLRYRPFLRRDFDFRCAYCERSEAVLGGKEFFEIDHFRPLAKFPDLGTHYPNLYYSCGMCNRHKSYTWPTDELLARGFRFADPCEEDMYSEHLQEMPDGKLRALTHCGRYTCDHIRLNRPDLLLSRRDKRRAAVQLRELEQVLRAAERDPAVREHVGAVALLIAQLRQRYSL